MNGHEGIVELGFREAIPMSIYLLPISEFSGSRKYLNSLWIVDTYMVGCETDKLSIFLTVSWASPVSEGYLVGFVDLDKSPNMTRLPKQPVRGDLGQFGPLEPP